MSHIIILPYHLRFWVFVAILAPVFTPVTRTQCLNVANSFLIPMQLVLSMESSAVQKFDGQSDSDDWEGGSFSWWFLRSIFHLHAQSYSDSDGMDSIPASPDALNVPLLFCPECLNEASLPAQSYFIFFYEGYFIGEMNFNEADLKSSMLVSRRISIFAVKLLIVLIYFPVFCWAWSWNCQAILTTRYFALKCNYR